MDLFTDHKSLQYMFTESELNLCQGRWLELLKDYNMNFYYHPGKANVVADGLRRISMGSIAHIEDGKNELVNDVHRLKRLGVRFVDSTTGGVSVHPSSESSLVVEFKKG